MRASAIPARILVFGILGCWGNPAVAEVTSAMDDNSFGIRTMQLISSFVQGAPKPENFVGIVREMENESGRTSIVPISTVSARMKGFRFHSISFSRTDNNLMMMSVAEKDGCFTGLHFRFFPRGDKIDVQFTDVGKYVCPTPVQVIPGPGSGS